MFPAAWLTAVLLFAAAPSFEELSTKAAQARDANRLEEAARLYSQALRLQPGWSQGWWNLGTVLYDQDRYSECADAFTHLVSLKPDMGPGVALLGLCEFNIKRYAPAIQHLLRADEIGFGADPQMRKVVTYHEALAYIKLENYEQALQRLTLLVRTSDADEQVRLAAGIAALRYPSLPGEIRPPDRDLAAPLGEAVVAELRRQPEAADRAYQAVLAEHPRAPGVHYVYGSFLLSSQPEKALAMLKAELEISPKHVPALAAIAGEYLKRDDANSAKPYAQRAAALAPKDFAARTVYGRTLLQDDDIPGAIRELQAAVELAPDSPQARYALASAYKRAGREDDAERERKAFMRLQKLINSNKN